MRKIKLTQGKYALVDDEDFEELSKYKWYSSRVEHLFYPRRSVKTEKGQLTIRMYRQIMGLEHGDGKIVDHINGNPLDNRRQNIRICTFSENAWNQKNKKNNTSGVKGVSWLKRNKKWIVRIGFNRNRIYLGLFKTLKEASKVYEEKAKELYTEYNKN